MEAQSDGVESEQFSEAFLCCVCLDLLYKPIVLACGHMSCFWCVHRSMSDLRESRCPICRHLYHHFPTICQMLHFLLLKMYPIAYKRRETQILEDEKEMGFFSPQFDALVCTSHTNEELNHPGDPGQSSTRSSLSTDLCSTSNGEPCVNMEQLESVSFLQANGTTISKQFSTGSFEAPSTVTVEEKNLPQRNCNGSCQQVLTGDVLCAACKQLLFRPVVLNCGHVYCESCFIIPADEALRCEVCQSPHPRGFPKVCLEIDHFLEEQFPNEYALRRGTVQRKRVHFQHESPTTCSTKAGKESGYFSFLTEDNVLPWWGDKGSKVHIGAGCDSCGMFPIIGDRYRCKDCMEAIGFDLCGDCYKTRSKLPGRFNQQHTPEHRLEIVKSTIRNIMVRLLRRQLDDGSTAFSLSNDASENPENASPSTLPSNAQENAENGLPASIASSDEDDHSETDHHARL
uniref:Putative E3 ubiquitin-protein ligase PRT1 isoform X2 n=1 Tax=Davidia involucrata TaxID=16924 RepID=A0A5B7BRT7_DAVIN